MRVSVSKVMGSTMKRNRRSMSWRVNKLQECMQTGHWRLDELSCLRAVTSSRSRNAARITVPPRKFQTSEDSVGTTPPKDSREVQHIVDELNDDRKRRDVGRSSPTVCPLRVCGCRDNPQQQNAATTPGFSGPFPSHSGVFGLPPLFVLTQSTLVGEYFFCGSYRLCLFGMPGVRVVSSWSVFGSPPLRTVRHCTEQVATDPQSPEGGS